MRAAFLGTDRFAISTLDRLIESPRHELAGVVTGPDKPAGRGRRLTPTPVRAHLLARGIDLPVLTPMRLKDPAFHERFRALRADVAVVVAFRILPPEVFDAPRYGTLNVHPSLLPRFRGPAPINWTLIEGETETGVSVIRITSRVDAGGVLMQKRVPVDPLETAGELAARLAPVGAGMVLDVLDALPRGERRPIPQDESAATKAPKLGKRDGRLDWSRPAREVHNRARGVTPWPGALSTIRGRQVKLFNTRPLADREGAPGAVLEAGGKAGRLVIACGEGALEVGEIQLQGKKRMSVSDFLRGFPIEPGACFDGGGDG
ncbi:MAG: Methionyl-tRNA formyltransferase [Calditrichaeota bacterium]|nr:Methionyl-tRNA formyltransferase [Calditrichota bacterium]